MTNLDSDQIYYIRQTLLADVKRKKQIAEDHDCEKMNEAEAWFLEAKRMVDIWTKKMAVHQKTMDAELEKHMNLQNDAENALESLNAFEDSVNVENTKI